MMIRKKIKRLKCRNITFENKTVKDIDIYVSIFFLASFTDYIVAWMSV